MDDRAKRRGALPFGVGRHSSCFASKELDHEARTTRYPTRIGSNTRIAAVKNIEDKEQGQSSKSDGCPSSRKTLSQKSVLPVPKLGSSSTVKPRKMSRVLVSSGMSGQSSSTRNLSLGLGQLTHGGAVFQRGAASSSSRLGLAEISNLTSTEGSSCDFNFLQETPSSSLRRSIFHSNSGIVRREPGDTSARYLSRLGSDSDLLNVNRRLSDLILEDEHEHVWTGIDDDCTTDMGTASTSSLSPGFTNDLPGHSILFNDPENTSDDSFVSVSSMAGDLFDVNAVSTSDYLLRSGPLINQRSQEQGNLRRGVTGHADNTSVSLGEEINISKSSMSKRRTPSVRTASQVASRGSSHENFTTRSGAGSGLTERYVERSSAMSSRRNLGKFGCSSASDVLPLNVSSFNPQHSEQSGNRRVDPGRRTTDGRDSARGHHMAKVPLANNAGGPVSQRTIRSGGANGPHCQLSSTPRASRKTGRAIQPRALSYQEIQEGDNIVDLGLSSERSSTNVHVSDQNQMLGNRHRALSPSLTRGRSPIVAFQRRNDLSNGEGCTLGERVANRLGATTRRSTSTNAASARFFGLAGSPSRLNSICSDSGSSSYNLLTEEEIGNMTPIISGPAPSRAPPLPPVAPSVQPQVNSSLSLSLPFSGPVPHALLPVASSGSASQAASVGSNSLHLFDGTTFGRSAAGSDVPSERPMVVQSESSGRRAFRSLSFESHSPTQYAMEGLAEVLLALERIEQDDDLTYEQVLMLEANLLFGGISMHDQHSDMRLDIDNMSYEELLALEDRIGSVSTGLTEEAISKSMKRILFVSDVAFADSNSPESEVKCSVCQEEYEEGDEIGRLKCEHSYHADCIQKWLLQKNQCPICKAPASP